MLASPHSSTCSPRSCPRPVTQARRTYLQRVPEWLEQLDHGRELDPSEFRDQDWSAGRLLFEALSYRHPDATAEEARWWLDDQDALDAVLEGLEHLEDERRSYEGTWHSLNRALTGESPDVRSLLLLAALLDRDWVAALHMANYAPYAYLRPTRETGWIARRIAKRFERPQRIRARVDNRRRTRCLRRPRARGRRTRRTTRAGPRDDSSDPEPGPRSRTHRGAPA